MILAIKPNDFMENISPESNSALSEEVQYNYVWCKSVDST